MRAHTVVKEFTPMVQEVLERQRASLRLLKVRLKKTQAIMTGWPLNRRYQQPLQAMDSLENHMGENVFLSVHHFFNQFLTSSNGRLLISAIQVCKFCIFFDVMKMLHLQSIMCATVSCSDCNL